MRSAREARALTLSDVEAETKIRQKYLLAIENDRPNEFPAPVYGRGYVRTYASALGLDPAEMVALFDRIRPTEIVGVQREAKPPRMSRAITGATIFAILAILVILASGYYLFQQYSLFLSSKPPEAAASSPSAPAQPTAPSSLPAIPPAAAPVVAPSPTAAPSPTPTPIRGVHLQVRVKERTWLRVLVDDQLRYEGIPQTGSELAWDGNDKITMRTGNAGGVEVTFNGKAEGPLGAPGEVKDVQWTAQY